jgi:hypothetical protein
MPGSRGLSPAPSPLRTVRASFPAHGSSTLQASSGCEETRSFCFEWPVRYASAAPSPSSSGRTHGLASVKPPSFAFPSVEVPQIISHQSTCRKSAPFQAGKQFPYPACYRPAFAFFNFLYPLTCVLSLRVAFHIRVEIIGLTMFRSSNPMG